MAEMNPAIEITLKHEGGYVNDPHDYGGETYKGIDRKSDSSWSGWAIIDSLKIHSDFPAVLDQSQSLQSAVLNFYQQNFWKPWMAEINSQAVANKVFDMSFLLSIKTAVRMLQRALGFSYADQDGNPSLETLASVNDAGDNLLSVYKRVLVNHFQWIVKQDPSQERFLQGWENRANS